MNFNTVLLHDKSINNYPDREMLPPVSQVSAFAYESMEELEKVFQHKSMGYAYTRIGNPTISALEKRLSALEHGQVAICTGSGMSAITSSVLAVCTSGDEIIASSGLYGGTIGLFHDLEKLGIHTIFIDNLTEESLRQNIGEKTRLVFCEMISNPSLNVANVPAIAKAAHEAGVPLFVDSTIATPYIVNPITLGADVVIHSTSKYLNGGGNAIGGVIIYSGKFNWDFDKHTALSEYRKYRSMAFAVRLRTDIWQNTGGCQSPLNAFLTYIGMDTLGIRMERICKNADALAKALSETESVEVNYLTLNGHPCHPLVNTLLNGYGGGILSFRAGSRERAFGIINHLKYACIASNIGDVRTLVIHPASTLYLNAGKAEMEAAGVYEDTIRVSVGIEDEEDLIEDFLEAIRKTDNLI